MAKGQKTGGKNFKPGESGNPNGRPRVPADLKAARELNQIEFERTVNALLGKTKEELTELLKDSSTPAITILVARIIRTAMWSGDHKRLEFLLNRMIGRPRIQEPPKTTEGKKSLSFIDLVIQAEQGGSRGTA